jgi:hypothetical protein
LSYPPEGKTVAEMIQYQASFTNLGKRERMRGILRIRRYELEGV